MEVKEGTYILNAAAVEFAGEQDIRKMIMDAQKEAVRRGVTQDSGERASELVDIAVSSGEVTIAPHLVKIIGEDRLEKINKRGIRKTEQRIAENEQQPAQAARGGFLA
jgi:pimeloyl-CoA synthetase